MANTENLIPQSERTKEEQREIARKGGIKSGEVRRRKRAMRETLELILSMALSNQEAMELTDIEDIQSFADANGKNITVQDAMILKQVQLALAGSSRSFEIVRDTVGEKPKERIETNKEALDKLDEVLKEIGGVV